MRKDDKATALEELILGVRGAFHAFRQAADALHADLGITTPMRAVLDHIVTRGPATVPEIAASKRVTRQFVQQIADPLAAAGFVTFEPNPRHRRSPILTPTESGEDVFRAAVVRERELFTRIAGDFERSEIELAAAVLRGLTETIDAEVPLGTR